MTHEYSGSFHNERYPIGLGATLTTDLWALFLKRTFKIGSPNYCLVGRWLRYMSEGVQPRKISRIFDLEAVHLIRIM